MGIQMVGVDHNTASIDIRTVFSFTKKNTALALERLKAVKGIAGCVLLSTCNRMELWISTESDYTSDLYELLCEIRQVAPEDYISYFQFRQEREAVCHLFRLASGLESRILGEDQIVTQVGDALAFAREHYAADHVLETLFRQAVTAAKKIKTAGLLSAADQSVVHIALQDLQRQGMEFTDKKCMVIGNGVMGKLAATLLQRKGADVTVTVRQYRSGIVEIPAHCSRIDYGRRMEIFGDCDIVFSATVSPNYTLTRELIEDHIKKPMVLVDLAVPRDIDPLAGALPQVRLYDIDCFREEGRSQEQMRRIARAEACLEKQMEEFFIWYDCMDVIPKIQMLKREIGADVVARLQKPLRELPVEDAQRKQLRTEIDGAAERAVNKLLFGLRDGLDPNTLRVCLGCLEELYRNKAPY